MAARFLLMLMCVAQLPFLLMAGGHGGGHKKVIIHVPYKVHHHHHKHTIVKHIHHKAQGGGGDDHYEVLGYTYGEPKAAPHIGGGKGWHAADESDSYGHESPVSFEGDQGHGLQGVSSDHGLGGGSDSGYGLSSAGSDYGGYMHSSGGEEHGSY